MKPAPIDPATLPVANDKILNIPNSLTALRLLAVPALIWLLALDTLDARAWATVVFLLAAFTDLLDGAIARKRGEITSFGKLADPIADKALIGSALIGLSLMNDLAWWITIVILVRELGVTFLRMWVLKYGVIPASRGGKAKTMAQIIAISMYLYVPENLAWWNNVAEGVMAVAILLTLITGFDYVMRALKLRRSSNG
jgi:CDP-diacylglycerol---glycerol-3-phosphate 3-phosphatidyltransferase